MRAFQSLPRLPSSGLVVLVLAGGIVVPAQAQDLKIETSARNSYTFMTYLKEDTIKVASDQGVVTLTGTVSQEWHRTLAEETVAGLPGVKRIDNLLKVSGESPTEHSDEWISWKVRSALMFHQNVSGTDTVVDTDQGVVSLSGKVDSWAQKELTAEYAKDVEGVTEVRNNLEVVAKVKADSPTTLGEKVDDASITAQVKTSLLFHRSTRILATQVITREGVVTLRGEALNAAERDLVKKLAEDIKGVKHVDNRMTVKKS